MNHQLYWAIGIVITYIILDLLLRLYLKQKENKENTFRQEKAFELLKAHKIEAHLYISTASDSLAGPKNLELENAVNVISNMGYLLIKKNQVVGKFAQTSQAYSEDETKRKPQLKLIIDNKS